MPWQYPKVVVPKLWVCANSGSFIYHYAQQEENAQQAAQHEALVEKLSSAGATHMTCRACGVHGRRDHVCTSSGCRR